MTTLSVILLTYNTRSMTLDSLTRLAPDARSRDWQVIVVDNASTDGTAEAVAHRFPSVDLIRSEENRGYAAGNNLGLRQATGEILLLLNSDIIATAAQLQALVDYLRCHPDVGAVSAGLRTRDGSPQAFAYGSDPHPLYLLRRGAKRLLGRGPLHDWAIAEPIDVDWVSGACLCVRRPAVAQVGLLDEHFFLYFEDNDWCLRMRQAGWRIVYNPRVQVVHLGGTSQPQRRIASRHYAESLRYFYYKHYGKLPAFLLQGALSIYRWLAVFRDHGVSATSSAGPK